MSEDDDYENELVRRLLAPRIRRELDPPLQPARVMHLPGGMAWIQFHDGQGNAVRDVGKDDPQPLAAVMEWADHWNRYTEAKWPIDWISPLPKTPATAGEMLAETAGYGPTLDVKIEVSPGLWRTYSPTKEGLRDELAKLEPDAPAIIPLEGGYRFQCFGTTLSVFGPAGDGLYSVVAAGEYASIVLLGETIDPA